MNKEELKACPFCGEKVEYHDDNGGQIICDECGFYFDVSSGLDEHAVKAWNIKKEG